LVYLGLIRFLVGAIDPSQQTPSLLEVFGRLGALYALLRSVLEELFTRGFLLGQLLRFTTSFRAQASVALLFACAHLPAWLALDGPSLAFLPSLIVLTLLGAVLGKMTRASNSIVPAIVLHWVNNLLAS
jgi:membrane protease YdiL (CAAX protease family)